MQVEPQKEHQWLTRLVGEWECEGECVMAPGQEPMKFNSKETVRSLGGLWVLGESRGEMPGGGEATMLMTLGYDPARQRYFGTFVGSMMTHLFVYDGAVDAGGTVLTLDTEGPSCTGEPKLVRYKDVIEVKDDDHRVLRSSALGDDGQWHQFMTAHYRRVKQAATVAA